MHLALLLLAAIALAIAGCGAAARPPQPGAASAIPVASAVATIQVENQREGGDSAKTIDYVSPELFPDLAPLKAASDLVIRGISEGADRFAITEVLVNRLQVDPSTVRLRLIQQPPDDPPLHSAPPLVAGLKYVLFLRAFWNPIPDFFRASHTFRPIGGPQGQWLIRDGAVIQQAEVPLKKALDGETLDRFVSALNGTPDLRAVAAALLQKHGWGPSEPEARMDDVASAAVLERDAEYRARLEASRGIGWTLYPTRAARSCG